MAKLGNRFMEILRLPKRSTVVAEKKKRQKSCRKGRFSLLRSAGTWKVAALAPLLFACCWPQYKCEMKASTATRFVKNSCYYDGKPYSLGIVIETAHGVKCECAPTSSDGFPTWVSGNWS